MRVEQKQAHWRILCLNTPLEEKLKHLLDAILCGTCNDILTSPSNANLLSTVQMFDVTGAKISKTQKRLSHVSGVPTSIYLQMLRADKNPYANNLVKLLGMKKDTPFQRAINM